LASSKKAKIVLDHVVLPAFGADLELTGKQRGLVIASASCIDVTADVGSWSWTAGHDSSVWKWVNLHWELVPVSSARKDTIASDSGGATCFLTGVGGKFMDSDWNEGVFISKEGSQFFMNTKNGRTGHTTCVR